MCIPFKCRSVQKLCLTFALQFRYTLQFIPVCIINLFYEMNRKFLLCLKYTVNHHNNTGGNTDDEFIFISIPIDELYWEQDFFLEDTNWAVCLSVCKHPQLLCVVYRGYVLMLYPLIKCYLTAFRQRARSFHPPPDIAWADMTYIFCTLPETCTIIPVTHSSSACHIQRIPDLLITIQV